MASEKFGNIQALRALAAISVVVVHAAGTSIRYTTATSHLVEPAKYLSFGVDLFFVISGFVIYLTTTQSNLLAAEFIKRRLQRIVPLYWLLTIAFFACLQVIPGLNAAALTDWPKFVASLGFASFAHWGMPVIYPGWTLEYEMVFYALTAVALASSRRQPWAFVSIALCAATLARPWIGSDPYPVLDFLTNSIVLSFVGGIVVAQWALNGRPAPVEAVAFSVAIAAAAVNDPMQRALYAGLPWAVVVYAAVKAGPTKAHPWLMKLGDASYAIYLLHVFLIAVVGKVSRALAPSLNADLLAVAMTISALLAGLALHQWVERPMARLWKRQRSVFAPRLAA